MTRPTEIQPTGNIGVLQALSGRLGFLAWTLGLILSLSFASAAVITWIVPSV